MPRCPPTCLLPKPPGCSGWPGSTGFCSQDHRGPAGSLGSSRLPSTITLINTLSAEASRQGNASQNCERLGHQGPGFLNALADGRMQVTGMCHIEAAGGSLLGQGCAGCWGHRGQQTPLPPSVMSQPHKDEHESGFEPNPDPIHSSEQEIHPVPPPSPAANLISYSNPPSHF